MPMANRVTLTKCRLKATREMGKSVKDCGFEQREIGDVCVQTYYYSVEYDELGTHYRADVYVNGKNTTGYSIT